jgi:ABC-type Na+ efflux pump permease subunit
MVSFLIFSIGTSLPLVQGLVSQSFSVDKDTIKPQESAIVTVTLTNPDNVYGTTLSQGFAKPSPNVAGSLAITGGGAVYLSAGETKTVTLEIKNTGNLAQDSLTAFTYSITNQNDETIYTKDISLLLKQGLNLATESPSPTTTLQQHDQNNFILLLAFAILVVLILSLVCFTVFSVHKRKSAK